MPSWKVHRIVCRRFCNYYNPEIDSIVDEEDGHDISRYDVERLAKTVEYVRSKHGERGLCQLIVHHYLDRLVDLMIHELVEAYSELDTIDPEVLALQIVDRIMEFLPKDPGNILSLMINDLTTLSLTANHIYRGRRRQKSRSRKKHMLMIAYFELRQPQYSWLLELLGPVIRKVLDNITNNLNQVLCLIFTDENSRSRLINRCANALTQRYQPHELFLYPPSFWSKVYRSRREIEKKDILSIVQALMKTLRCNLVESTLP